MYTLNCLGSVLIFHWSKLAPRHGLKTIKNPGSQQRERRWCPKRCGAHWSIEYWWVLAGMGSTPREKWWNSSDHHLQLGFRTARNFWNESEASNRRIAIDLIVTIVNCLVGGLEHLWYFSMYCEFHHPHWLSYFSAGWLNHQPVVVGIKWWPTPSLQAASRGATSRGWHWCPVSQCVPRDSGGVHVLKISLKKNHEFRIV